MLYSVSEFAVNVLDAKTCLCCNIKYQFCTVFV